jgi:RNA polymerase sigma factor (sigma-70 family)
MKSPALPFASDADLVAALRAANPAAYTTLYSTYFPSVAYYVRGNQGSLKDAEDLFQETLLVLVDKLSQPDFHLSASLKTYLHAIARNLWLKKLRDQKETIVEDAQYFVSLPDPALLPDAGLHTGSTPEEQLPGWLNAVTDTCQCILSAIYLEEEPMEDLMARMGWKNRHTADNQKYKCVQQVKKVARRLSKTRNP